MEKMEKMAGIKTLTPHPGQTAREPDYSGVTMELLFGDTLGLGTEARVS